MKVTIKISVFLLLLLVSCGDVITRSGRDGIDGPAGAAGRDGLNGSSCVVTQITTGAYILCADGSFASINNGLDGHDGKDGTNGTNGLSPIPVKLCADDSSSYPEYGFRLGTQLFAVYWSPSIGAFLALLTPGRYMSTNGTGCTFTALADGTVIR